MTKREFERLARQVEVLCGLGFTRDEADKLRRISMTLRRWHELECGDGNGCIERDEKSGKAFYLNANSGRRYPIADRETGALNRLSAIVRARNFRDGTVAREIVAAGDTIPNLRRGLSAYIQSDPRGAALYILRPGDIPDGQTADACYSRGICVY